MIIRTITVLILSSFLTTIYADYTDELRIHEQAPLGTRMTPSIELKRKLDKYTNCYGRLDCDVPWIEYREATNDFVTTQSLNYVNLNTREQMQGELTMMCPGGKMDHLVFSVHLTKENRHAPSFKYPSQEIYVPIGTNVGGQITQLEVTDHDAVIYNSQRTLSFKSIHPLFTIFNDGTITLKQTIHPNQAYKPIHVQVVAVDYGSPQRHSEMNLTIIPVTVSQVRNLHVNVASDRYQIFEWEAPEYGIPDKYRLLIKKGEQILADEEVDAKSTRILTRVKIGRGWDVTYSVSSVSISGETNSPKERFTLLHNKVECMGDCGNGGLPLCYYGPLNTLQQYIHSNGLKHCQCYPGYIGIECTQTESCSSEKKIDTYGGLDWPEVRVNITARLRCPYNSDDHHMTRACEWDAMENRAVWGKVVGHDKCITQLSILTHLGMLATYASKAQQISPLITVNNFIKNFLNVPSFASSGPAHFDQKIAQHIVMVLETALRINFSHIRGNTTDIKRQLLSSISSLSTRLPVPFILHAETHPYLSYNVLNWVADTENFRTGVGASCYIQLPIIADDNVMRAVCMGNGTLVETINTRNPILMMNVDKPDTLVFNKITFGLKTFNSSENYTCVYYDEIEKAWSTRGIRRISQSKSGFVECETTHLSTFSLLPESSFSSSSSLLHDFALVLPTVTSFLAIVCSVFLLFLAAIQRGPSIDYPLLLFLFLVFIIHSLHLLTLLAPQLGDPFLQSPTLHLVYQFCVISVCALVMLLAQSINTVIMSFKSNDKPEPPLCSTFCSTFIIGLVIPALLTSTTYFFAQQNRHELTRILTRLDWIFILNFLSPCILFTTITILFCLSSLKASHSSCRSSITSSLSLSPASYSSSTLIILIFLLLSHIIIFIFRDKGDGLFSAFFSLLQMAYSLMSFVFAGYLFRLRYMQLNGDELSTRSLERKRDISRALLSHVDARPSQGESLVSEGCMMDVGHNDGMTTSSFGVIKNGGGSTHPCHHSAILRTIKPSPSPSPPLLNHDHSPPPSFTMSASLFDRTPMVSIV